MGNIKFNASKKTTIILLVVLFFIIGGSGGYLLWRVNQQKSVAPSDSEASVVYPCGGEGQPECDFMCRDRMGQPGNGGIIICSDAGDCVGRVYCEYPWNIRCLNCITCECVNECERWGPMCEPPPCPSGYHEIPNDGTLRGRPQDGQRCDSTPRPDKCLQDCRMECASCKNPSWVTRYCQKDVPANTCDGVGSSTGDIKLSPTNPESCKPVSFEHTVGDTDGVGTVTVTLDGSNIAFREDVIGKTKKITGTIAGEKNCSTNPRTLKISWKDVHGAEGPNCTKSIEYTPKEAPPTVEKCDGIDKGTVIKFIPSTVKKGGILKYEYTMGDSKGIDLDSVRVLVNHSSFDVEKNLTPDSGTPKKATVDGKLDTSKVGNYHVLIAWKRPGESGISEACQIRGNFTVEDVGAPKWDVGKTASEECIVDSAGESIAKLTYTITIKNNGNATGTITNVTDKLDSKVVGGSVTDISDGGTYSSSDRSIKWGSFNIAAGQTKTLTYSFTVRKDAFGVYDNVVIVKPSDGADYVANASITADCVEEPYQPPVEGGKVPDTGLFDESENLVIMGGILLFLGLGWTWLNRTYQIVNGKLVQRSKERFEQRVVKN